MPSQKKDAAATGAKIEGGCSFDELKYFFSTMKKEFIVYLNYHQVFVYLLYVGNTQNYSYFCLFDIRIQLLN